MFVSTSEMIPSEAIPEIGFLLLQVKRFSVKLQESAYNQKSCAVSLCLHTWGPGLLEPAAGTEAGRLRTTSSVCTEE